MKQYFGVQQLQKQYDLFNQMRRRSGGIHCETQEEFIELAELSQEKCGLYYDDNMNSQLNNLKQNSKIHAKNVKQQQDTAKQKSRAFQDFDFSEQMIFLKEERNELESMSGHRYHQNHVIILTGRVNDSKKDFQTRISTIFQQENQMARFNGLLRNETDHFLMQNQRTTSQKYQSSEMETQDYKSDLFIVSLSKQHSPEGEIYKFWFFDPKFISNCLLQAYTKSAFRIYQISSEKQQISQSQKSVSVRKLLSCDSIVRQIFIFPMSSSEKFSSDIIQKGEKE